MVVGHEFLDDVPDTRSQHFRRSSGVSNLPAVASRWRWPMVNDNFLPPVAASNCSRRMRLSSST
jgi:hypothetical protein